MVQPSEVTVFPPNGQPKIDSNKNNDDADKTGPLKDDFFSADDGMMGAA
jgi:hypothetical protein